MLKKIYAVVNLSCKEFDGRFKRVYNEDTLKIDIMERKLLNIPLR